MSSHLSEVILPEYFYDIEDVRIALEKVTEENLERKKKIIGESKIFAKEKKTVADLINKYSEIRDNKQGLYAKIASYLSQKSQSFSRYILEAAEKTFLRLLYLENAVEFQDVYKKIKDDPLNRIFFAPELKIYQEKENWTSISKRSSLNALRANNWYKFNDIIEHLSEENTLERALREDDSEFLVNQSTTFNFTATSELLEQAAQFGAVKCFKFLLLSGAKVTEECANAAIKGGSLEIVRICDQLQVTFAKGLKVAIDYQRDEIFDWLLNRCNTDSIRFNDFVKAHFYRGIKYAIDNSYCIDNTANYKKSPLHEAVACDDALMARLLIEGSVDPNARDINGKTPLHIVKSTRMSLLLINCGADPNARDKSGATPIFSALQRDDIKIINTLVANGADINAANVIHKTALYYAREWKKTRSIETLIKLGCTKSVIRDSNVSLNIEEEHYSNGRIILE